MNEQYLYHPPIKANGQIQIDIQTSVAFLYASNEQFQNEIRKTIPFMVSSKRLNYLGINLTKEMQDFYTGNYGRSLKSQWPKIGANLLTAIFCEVKILIFQVCGFLMIDLIKDYNLKL